MKLVPFLLALTLLGAAASGAAAAPRSDATTTDLCSVAKGVALSITHAGASLAPTAGSSLAAMSRQLKATFTRVKEAEPIVLNSSPGSLKPHFVKVFAFYNLIYEKLSKANWNLLALEKSAQSLQVAEAKIEPDLRAIKAYFDRCKK